MFPNEPKMHSIASPHRMFESYLGDYTVTTYDFLVEEVKLLEEVEGISLSNFLTHFVLVIILQRRIDYVPRRSRDITIKACKYINKVVCHVIDMQIEC